METITKLSPEEISIGGERSVKLRGVEYFDVNQVFDCGQCFRFDPAEAGGFEGVAMGRYVRFSQPKLDELIIHGATLSDYLHIWRHYLALDLDYKAVREDIDARFDAASGSRDVVMDDAMRIGSGIRILRQEPWETICSFIISQNNNIPRIKKIIAEMCRRYGEPIEHGDKIYHAFPTADALYSAGVSGIYELRTGFRAKYIYDAAESVVNHRLDFDAIRDATPSEAMEMLCEIKGVGPKVASCAMLFGFDKTEAFPIDVWIKRVLAKYYPDGLDINELGRYAGIAQQYLFYYERYIQSGESK